MQETDFVREITAIMREENIPNERIALEITESFMIETLDPLVETLERLKAAGFRLSLDDFGKGYSSHRISDRFPSIHQDRQILYR
jgi:EAL domain-containing protein (putative c-di-GMP-specific phosphodiesterase class I)